jgi:outer membrane protein
MRKSIYVLIALLFSGAAKAQSPMHLTLPEAERLAVRNNPSLTAAQLMARAADQTPIEIRSGLQPTVYGSVTGVGADSGSRLAAGALNNPVVYNRLGTGITVNQLITDFGRTRSLIESAKFRAAAENQVAETVDANIVMQTDRAYLAVLRAQAVLTVAQQTVSARQTVADQVSQLFQNKLKSGLDLSFANVNLAQAKIQLSAAQNDLSSSIAQLATVLGLPGQTAFDLVDEPMPGPVDAAAEGYIQEAVQKRPELANLRYEVNAGERTLDAERASWYPTIGAIGTAGFVPAGEGTVPGRYGAIGVNVSIPIFNGGLFRARRTEAELRLESSRKNVEDLQNRVTRDVRMAWLAALTAYEQVGLTAQLLAQARDALDLAQGRYGLGLSSIVELSQAQLNFTAAQIGNAGAKFDYQVQHSFLQYQIGNLR